MTSHPSVRRTDDGSLEITVDDQVYRVLSWMPPRLLLGRGQEVRTFFLAASSPGSGQSGWWLGDQGQSIHVPSGKQKSHRDKTAKVGHDDLSSPMPGKVLEVLVSEGDNVTAGTRLLIVEAMKMENPLRAPHDSVVTRIHVSAGESVTPGQTLIELDENVDDDS